MNVSGQDDRQVGYTTPHRVQAWFLKKSRDNWKKKYGDLKVNANRLHNRVKDVSQSREQWREESRQLTAQVRQLERENAALQEQLAALKKDGRRAAAGTA